MSRLAKRMLIGCTLAVSALVFGWRIHVAYAADLPITARGGERFDLLLPVPDLKQHDPRWAETPIGGSQEPLREVGCALCSSAMLFAFHGILLPPDELNQRLQQVDGFTDQGRLKWDSLVELSAGRLHLDYVGSPSHERIDRCLRERVPVLAKTPLGSAAGHWVLIVGKRGDDYLVNDPLAEGPEPVLLSALSAEISSIRILR